MYLLAGNISYLDVQVLGNSHLFGADVARIMVRSAGVTHTCATRLPRLSLGCRRQQPKGRAQLASGRI